jgi:hypothetical protein
VEEEVVVVVAIEAQIPIKHQSFLRGFAGTVEQVACCSVAFAVKEVAWFITK